jgi:cell division septal protein FtsQ
MPSKDEERRREEDEQEEARRTRGLAGLAVVLLLSVMGLFLVKHLAAVSQIEDCLLAGRNNCMPLDLTAKGE